MNELNLKIKDERTVFSPLTCENYSYCASDVNIMSPKLKKFSNSIISASPVSWFVEPFHYDSMQKYERPQTARPIIETSHSDVHLSCEEEVAICEFFPETLGHMISHIPKMQTDSSYACCSKKEKFSLIPSHSLSNLSSSNCSSNEINQSLKKQKTTNSQVGSLISERFHCKCDIQPHLQRSSDQCIFENKLNEPCDGILSSSTPSNDREYIFSPSSDGNTSSDYPFMSSAMDNIYFSLQLDKRNTFQNEIIHRQHEDLIPTSLKIFPDMRVSPFCYYYVKFKSDILNQKEKYLLLHRRFLELERLRAPQQKWYEIQGKNFHDEARRYAAMEMNTKLLPKIQHQQKEVLQSVLLNSTSNTACP